MKRHRSQKQIRVHEWQQKQLTGVYMVDDAPGENKGVHLVHFKKG